MFYLKRGKVMLVNIYCDSAWVVVTMEGGKNGIMLGRRRYLIILATSCQWQVVVGCS